MVVIAKKPGHLCNRLFLFAHLIAGAMERRERVLNPSFGEFSDWFVNLQGLRLPRFPAPCRDRSQCDPTLLVRVRKVRDKLYLASRRIVKILSVLSLTKTPLWQVVEATLDDVVDLTDATWLSPKGRAPIILHTGYFVHDTLSLEKHQDEIRSFFAPLPSLIERAHCYVTSLRDGADVLVGVHVRRGDYARWRGGRYFYTYEEYRFYMQQVVDCHSTKRVRFIVCSNETVPWNCFFGLDVFPGSETVMGDLLCLSECDLIMGPPSSFSRWAAFYGQKPIFSIEGTGQAIGASSFRSVFEVPWLRHAVHEGRV
jgi:hypothetical protein